MKKSILIDIILGGNIISSQKASIQKESLYAKKRRQKITDISEVAKVKFLKDDEPDVEIIEDKNNLIEISTKKGKKGLKSSKKSRKSSAKKKIVKTKS